MGVSMDTFLKQLLVERSAEPSIVIVDNAKYHAERWSKLPGRVRFSLMPSKGDPTCRDRQPKKKLIGRSLSNNSNRTSDDRWSCSSSESLSPKREKPTFNSVPLAPPSCPQRQQSIEVTADALAQMSCCRNVSTQDAPSCPERRQSLDYSPNTVLDNTGHLPRMPERQASDDPELYACLPPPPMAMASAKKSASAPLLESFSSSVKRSMASLLDDDDDSDDDMMGGSLRYGNVPMPFLVKNPTF